MEPKNESDVASALRALRVDVLQRIQLFAQTGDTSGLFKANDWLRNAVSFSNRYETMLREGQQILASGQALLQPQAASVQPVGDEDSKGQDDQEIESVRGKARGRECREAFVRREKRRGKNLEEVQGQIYRNGVGVRVGIAYGKSKKDGTKWFLGLPENKFDEAVLLCELLGGKIQPFALPREFVDKYKSHLSVSKQWNQVKFNVSRDDNRFFLSVPRVTPVNIMPFADPEPMEPPPSQTYV